MLDSGCLMSIGRFERPHREVGVQAMPDARLDKMRHVESVCEVPLCAGVLRLLVPIMAVGLIIHCR
jgi:hypothetical protein